MTKFAAGRNLVNELLREAEEASQKVGLLQIMFLLNTAFKSSWTVGTSIRSFGQWTQSVVPHASYTCIPRKGIRHMAGVARDT